MAKLLKLRRGTTSQHSSFTGAEGEVTVDTDKETLVVHDGSTAGGHPVAAQDMANVPAGTILGTQLENSGVTAGQYGSSSAIPIVTVDAQGLVTAASTTSIDSTRIDNGTSNVRVNNNGNIVTTRSGTDRFTVTNSGVAVVGNLTTTDNITVTSAAPKIFLVDSDTNDDFSINGDGDTFRIKSETDGANRFVVNSDGHVDIPGNLDVGAGIDVTGAIASTGNLEITNTLPKISLVDSDNNDDFDIKNQNGTFIIADATDSVDRFTIASNGTASVTGNLDVSNGVDVTGNITVSGTVDGVDVATRDTLFGGLTSSSGVLTNGVTATTQGTSDNTTKVATTAYVTTAVANAEPFPSGTKMLFQQSSAPTGWTKITSSVDNKALRLVSGNVSSGGNAAFTTAFASRTPAGNVGTSGNSTASFSANATTGNSTASFSGSVSGNTGNSGASTSSVSTSGSVNNHTLSNNQVPSHSHSFNIGNPDSYGNGYRICRQNSNNAGNFGTNSSGGGGSHSHGFSGSSHSHNVNNHTHSFSGNFSGNTGNHTHSVSVSGNTGNHTHSGGSFSGSAMDFAVQYIDVIVCSKD